MDIRYVLESWPLTPQGLRFGLEYLHARTEEKVMIQQLKTQKYHTHRINKNVLTQEHKQIQKYISNGFFHGHSPNILTH
jgi:hypothetical protein